MNEELPANSLEKEQQPSNVIAESDREFLQWLLEKVDVLEAKAANAKQNFEELSALFEKAVGAVDVYKGYLWEKYSLNVDETINTDTGAITSKD